MKVNKILIASFLFANSQSGFSANTWKDCATETKKFCRGVTGDEKIFECLEKHEHDLGKKCYEAHEVYEKTHGEPEGDEHDEKNESK